MFSFVNVKTLCHCVESENDMLSAIWQKKPDMLFSVYMCSCI